MIVIFLDTETTGLNPQKHRTIEIAFKITDVSGTKTLASYETIICQSKEVWEEADPLSLQINGFTYEEALKGKEEKAVEADIIQSFNQANIRRNGAVFLCQNPSFDRAFFSQIVSPDLQEHYHWPYHWLDLASMYFACQIQKDKDLASKIAEQGLSKDQIAKHYNLSGEAHPHRAMNGVRHLISCYRAVLSF